MYGKHICSIGWTGPIIFIKCCYLYYGLTFCSLRLSGLLLSAWAYLIIHGLQKTKLTQNEAEDAVTEYKKTNCQTPIARQSSTNSSGTTFNAKTKKNSAKKKCSSAGVDRPENVTAEMEIALSRMDIKVRVLFWFRLKLSTLSKLIMSYAKLFSHHFEIAEVATSHQASAT